MKSLLFVPIFSFFSILIGCSHDRSGNDIEIFGIEMNTLKSSSISKIDTRIAIGDRYVVHDNEKTCLASAIYWEARGEPLPVRRKVGEVVMNRVEDINFPDTVCGVVFSAKYDNKLNIIEDKCAFSWFCDKKEKKIEIHDIKYWDDANQLAENILKSKKRTTKATYFLTKSMNKKPSWYSKMRVESVDGNLVFLKDTNKGQKRHS